RVENSLDKRLSIAQFALQSSSVPVHPLDNQAHLKRGSQSYAQGVPMNVKASTRLGIPPKNAPATQKNIDALYNGLTSVIVGHPQASDPWTFYEVIDDYLGPWGAVGYPLGYGKFYCVAFNSNPKLSANPSTRRWVEKTTLQLQTALRDFIVARFRA